MGQLSFLRFKDFSARRYEMTIEGGVAFVMSQRSVDQSEA